MLKWKRHERRVQVRWAGETVSRWRGWKMRRWGTLLYKHSYSNEAGPHKSTTTDVWWHVDDVIGHWFPQKPAGFHDDPYMSERERVKNSRVFSCSSLLNIDFLCVTTTFFIDYSFQQKAECITKEKKDVNMLSGHVHIIQRQTVNQS